MRTRIVVGLITFATAISGGDAGPSGCCGCSEHSSGRCGPARGLGHDGKPLVQRDHRLPERPLHQFARRDVRVCDQRLGDHPPECPELRGATSGLPLAVLPPKDCTSCKQAGPDLFTQGETWRAYQESMTIPCQQNMSADGLYVVRHNPPHYFLDIPAADCLAYDLPYPALAADLANHTLPAYSFITPNLVNDMHTGTTDAVKVQTGDNWLANNLPPLLNSPEYLTGSMVIFVMWDEGLGGRLLKGADCTTSTDNSCHVPLLVISPYGTPAIAPTTQVNHYSVLKATEDLLGLPELGQATTAPDLRADYGLTPTP